MKNDELYSNIELFIAEKRTLGFKYESGEKGIRHFYQFVQKSQIEDCLSEEKIYLWPDSAKSGTSRNKRISILRHFSMYLWRQGYQVHLIPNTQYSVVVRNFTPYIYTKSELKKMFDTADDFGAFREIPNSQYSFPLILRMLYGCGLRISEAVSLKLLDVQVDKGVLKIKDTKFYKDRNVPMHPNLQHYCRQYCEKVHLFSSDLDWFFQGKDSSSISTLCFYYYFRKILHICNIREIDESKGARVHDMRHTFAVHCLKHLDSQNMDMNTMLPVLATYLGHTSYEGTGTYLRLTTDLHPKIIENVEEEFNELIPWEVLKL